MDKKNKHHFGDDGFIVTEAEPWMLQKMSIYRQFISSFVATVRDHVDAIAIVDLYAGNGLFSLGSSPGQFLGLPLMSLSIDLPIHKFLFCESDLVQLKALKIRINKHFRNKHVLLLEGTPEELIEKLIMHAPVDKGNFKSAVLCFCDPFSIEMPFYIVNKLALLGFSFVMPFHFVLNEKINYSYYLKSERLKLFLGYATDLLKEETVTSNIQFYKLLIRAYYRNMESLGFNGTFTSTKIDSGLFELPSYQIGFFSKKLSTISIQKSFDSQYSLFS
jgi:three-Cys-motif partner protein